MDRVELKAFFPGTAVFCGAESYAVPTVSALERAWQYFRARLWSVDLNAWRPKWQCNEFARAFASTAQECHALTTPSPADESVAVGEFWYVRDGSAAHALCAAITDRGLIFLEPQTGQPCELSASEFRSRFFVRF